MSIDRFFRISERGSTLRTEVLGGLTTFATMAYIIVVNPAILEFAGIPRGPSTVATILIAAIGCLLMALFANRPFAVAPYMGENAFIAFGLAAMGISWEQRLGAVFVSGVAFVLLTACGLRQWLCDAISSTMKHCFAVGIGLFLSFIGLYETGIVTGGGAGMPFRALLQTGSTELLRTPDVPVKIGNVHDPKVALAALGFFITVVLLSRRVKGAVFLGIVVTAAIGVLCGLGQAPTAVVATPFAGDYDLSPIFLKLDVVGVLQLAMLPVLLTLVLMAFLDTTGTLMGLGASAKLLDEQGRLPQVERPMMVDALCCIAAPVLGTSTTGAYIESAAGIREGARTGLAALVVALLFAASLFFIPLLGAFQSLSYAYGPALIVVGVLMLGSIKNADLDDVTEVVPGFATIVMMVFTYNIANGLTTGLALYPLMKLLAGRAKEVRPGAWVLALVCILFFVVGHVH